MDIVGEAEYDSSGESLAMSSDGMILAIGATYNDGNGNDSGHVRVFAWDGDNTNYVQRGLDINGEAEDNSSGESLAMSSDGMILATGAVGSESYSGHVRVFHILSITTTMSHFNIMHAWMSFSIMSCSNFSHITFLLQLNSLRPRPPCHQQATLC